MQVYKYTNKVNGKVYIGITTRDVETRHKEHLKDIDCGYVFHRALRKYGAENFDLEVIDTASNYDELKEKEKHYIAHYNSYARAKNSNGYNTTRGGEGTLGYRHTSKTKAKLSKLRKELYKHSPHPSVGRIVSKETREKQRRIMLGRYAGENNPYYGKTHSLETRALMSEKAKIRCAEGKHPMLGRRLSEKTRKLIGSYHKGKTISEEQRRAHSELMRGEKNPGAKQVVCVTTNEVFNYMGEAAQRYGLDRSNITKCCRGKIRWSGTHPETGEKLVWRYLEESAS